MTLASERRAQRAARTRSMRDGRRDAAPRRPTAQVEAARLDANRETLAQRRNGLPSFTNARKLATHADANNPARAFVQSSRSPLVFGCALRTKEAQPPRVNDILLLVQREVDTSVRYVVVECRAISTRMYEVALAFC